MAQKVQTFFIDDLDGSEAEGTVRFGLDGSAYEIDLNAEHGAALRGILGPYVEAGRRTGTSGRTSGHRPAVTGVNGRVRNRHPADGQGQREYLRLLGHQVNDRGRLPANLAAIPVPPRDQWPGEPGYRGGSTLTRDERAEIKAHAATLPAEAEPETAVQPAPAKTADAVAAKAVDAILPAAERPKPAGQSSKFSQGQRDKAVRLVLEGGSVTAVAQEQGVGVSSLRNWVKTAREEAAAAEVLKPSASGTTAKAGKAKTGKTAK